MGIDSVLNAVSGVDVGSAVSLAVAQQALEQARVQGEQANELIKAACPDCGSPADPSGTKGTLIDVRG